MPWSGYKVLVTTCNQTIKLLSLSLSLGILVIENLYLPTPGMECSYSLLKGIKE